MALRETYLAQWKKIPHGAIGIAVTRTAKSILAPSQALLSDWKAGRIDWSEYERRYRKEINGNDKAIEKLGEIKRLAQQKDVYIVCYEKRPPCHRFILLDILRERD